MAEQFGEYELLRKIATGGMAEIHLARVGGVEGFSRRVVVKRMLPQLAVRDDFVQMFLDEARLAANLVHPNIVQVFNLGEVDGSYFMAMELIDGPHLGALFAHSLRQRRPLPLELCAYIVARGADGLHFAHEQVDQATGKRLNIVHRDISPQNVLVSRHGDVKVTDFGVAKAETQKAKTRTGIIKGKVSYMSPEQCLGETVDRRTDVFALGVVLYELLTRRRLYREKSDLLIMQRITQEPVALPSSINPAVDAELDNIASRALSKEAGERFASASELSEALDVWLAMQGHADCRAQLQRWMDAHASGLGIAADEAEPSVGGTPAWEKSEPLARAPGDGARDLEDAGGTVSTPALDPARDLSDKHPRVDNDHALGPTIPDPRAHDEDTLRGQIGPVPSDTQVIDVTSQPDPMVVSVHNADPVLDTIPPPSMQSEEMVTAPGSPNDSLAEIRSTSRPLPAAALVGGIIAVLIAAGAGFFLLSDTGESDSMASIEPLDERDEGQGDDPAGGGEAVATADAGEGAAKAPAQPAVVHVTTDPAGVLVLVDGEASGNAPAEATFEITEPKTVRISAVFSDQAPVVQDVELAPGGEYPVLLSARARLSVRTTPAGASLTLGDKSLGVSPREDLWIDANVEHTLAIQLDGYQAWEQKVTAKPGERVILEPELQAVAPSPTKRSSSRSRRAARSTRTVDAGYGKLIVNSGPWAVVYVDGKRRGPTPLTLPKVRAGKHRVKVVNTDLGFSKSTTVDVRKDDKTSVGFRFEKKAGKYVLGKLIR